WLTGFGTTRIIRSKTGDVFVLDVGSPQAGQQIVKMHEEGKIGNVDAIFITHYHHDHNAGVPVVTEKFNCPVYAVGELCDILERPGAYRMPCIENLPLTITPKKECEKMVWNEFEFTFLDFPGQTLYHDALLVRRGEERPVLFVGDAFSPTGMDDYCTWNRNLLKDGKGFLYCIDKIRTLEPAPLIVNQHIDPPFEFDTERLDYMENALRERIVLLTELLDVPTLPGSKKGSGLNFGLDHAWCRFDPFVLKAKKGETVTVNIVITNHFDESAQFRPCPETALNDLKNELKDWKFDFRSQMAPDEVQKCPLTFTISEKCDKKSYMLSVPVFILGTDDTSSEYGTCELIILVE
ncbi:MAG: MBL fold metallo-hydrolase, partial [Thermoguttaceae bacterium]